ncbi:MAG TPA: hypothetical protein VNJ01_03680 [Bacteriovoracaceae bacterium]|nr:hypothetical protein [Bacteriovoracaceae bacterium]
MKDYSDLTAFPDKKLRTLRNNLNNRMETFRKGEKDVKALPPSHMLHGMEENQCKELLGKIQVEMKKRS